MLSRSIFNQTRAFSATSAKSQFAKFSAYGFVSNVQVRETKEGAPFVTYSLGVNKPVNKTTGEKEVEYFGVTVFNEGQVNYFREYINPGARVIVDGEVRNRAYIDQEGEKKYKVNFIQKSFEKIPYPRREGAETETAEEQ